MDQESPPPRPMDYSDPDEIARLLKRLIPFALTKIDKLLVSKLDPEDIVQSVFRNFFAELQKEPSNLRVGRRCGLCLQK